MGLKASSKLLSLHAACYRTTGINLVASLSTFHGFGMLCTTVRHYPMEEWLILIILEKFTVAYMQHNTKEGVQSISFDSLISCWCFWSPAFMVGYLHREWQRVALFGNCQLSTLLKKGLTESILNSFEKGAYWVDSQLFLTALFAKLRFFF